MFYPFFYLLRNLGIPISFQYVLEFFQALEKGLMPNLDRMFIVGRLVLIKKVEHYDLYEKAFALYFLGQEQRLSMPFSAQAILESRPFQKWLEKQIEAGNLQPEQINQLPLEELMRRFWDTLLQQTEEHHGGNRWVGTGGTSPWGHSGNARGGIRVQGASMHRSASKVIGQRRYVDYSGEARLSAENIRQALASLKLMLPAGPENEIDIDKSIDQTCRNGGEIELVFQRELRNKIKVVLLLDNGGYSMSPFVQIVRLLFAKMKDQFQDLDFYYFHNCIYHEVYSNPQRTQAYKLEKLLQKDPQTRVFIVGDANMGPAELFARYGAIDYELMNEVPGVEYLQLLANNFPYTVWLNPIEKMYWSYQSSTLSHIAQIFRMEPLTLDGLKKAVEYLKEQDPAK